MRYKLLHGLHFEKGVKYGQGSVIESNQNLKKAFPDRFVVVTDKAVVVAPQEDVVKAPVEILGGADVVAPPEPVVETPVKPLESPPANDLPIEKLLPQTIGADIPPDSPPDAPIVPKPKKKSFVVAKKKRERIED
jgi:hypothetical protein